MSIEAEQAVLGALMISDSAWHRVAHLLDADDFAAVDHRVVWECIAELARRNQPRDAVTVGEELEAAGRGELAHLALSMADTTPGAGNVVAYAEIVRGHAVRRRLRQIGQQLARIDETGDEALAEAQRLLSTVTTSARAESVSMADALKEVYRRMEERFSGVTLPVVPTPWEALNRLTGGGLGKGKLYIVGGRPGMGKTAWMRGFAMSAAELGQVAIISLEMDREEVAGMMLAGAARISYQHVRDPRTLPGDDWSAITAGMTRLQRLPISICDVPALSLPTISAEVRRLHAKRKLSAVVIDYLGLIELPDAERNDIAIGQITRGLKRLARDLSVPVVLLCQLSRKVEDRGDKRPMLSDLRDAGQIEQDADGIIFLYRDAYYANQQGRESPFGDIAEMSLAKQRGGATGVVPVVFLSERIEFADYDGPWPIAHDSVRPMHQRRGIGKKAA